MITNMILTISIYYLYRFSSAFPLSLNNCNQKYEHVFKDLNKKQNVPCLKMGHSKNQFLIKTDVIRRNMFLHCIKKFSNNYVLMIIFNERYNNLVQYFRIFTFKFDSNV